MVETRRLMTADELLRLPAGNMRHELIAGELIEMPPAGFQHGVISAEAAALLRNFVREHQLGGVVVGAETGFRIARAPDTVRAPDAAYLTAEQVGRVERLAGYPDFAPALLVEVVSPDDRATDVQAKVETWLGAGAQIVWVLYPGTRSAADHRPGGRSRRLSSDDVLDADPVLPGFTVRLADLLPQVPGSAGAQTPATPGRRPLGRGRRPARG